MGGAFSISQDNDELIDNLVDSGYIRNKKIELVFRAVDRGDYFLSCHRESAYKDFAWKHGNIHLSAPCIYSEVMQELDLKPGLSFLNLGSGTGYLSTMAGLLLSQKGVNHGVELHEDCVKYSYDRLDEFKQKSLALDEFDFCEPIFVQGNCLNVVQNRCYDRVYCGATCPQDYVHSIKEFVKVGGILIMPYEDKLVKATRKSETEWEEKTMLPVSFANLIVPTKDEVYCNLPEWNPLPLQELCRGWIRQRLRKNIWFEHSGTLGTRKPITLERRRLSPSHRNMRQFVIPLYEDSDELSESDDVYPHASRLLLNVNGPPGENLRTTLQLVRAVVQPPLGNADVENEYAEIFNNLGGRWPGDNDTPSTEEDMQLDLEFSSEADRQDTESVTSSDSACDRSQTEVSQINNESEESEARPQPTGVLSAYSNIIESDSDEEESKEEENAEAQQSKSDEKNVSDSGTAEDMDDKDSEMNDGDSNPPETQRNTLTANKRSSSGAPSNEPRPKRNTCRRFEFDHSTNAHYVDTNALSLYMKEKIHQLPLPHALKRYINYNRTM